MGMGMGMSGDRRDEVNEDKGEAAHEDRLIGEELARQRRQLGWRLVIIGAVVFVASAVVRLLGVEWVVGFVTVGAVMIFLGVLRLVEARKTLPSHPDRCLKKRRLRPAANSERQPACPR